MNLGWQTKVTIFNAPPHPRANTGFPAKFEFIVSNEFYFFV